MNELGYNPNGYVIRVSENALIQMCMNGLEAYLIEHKQGNKAQKGIETYGLLWGHQIIQPDDRTLYCIEMVSIDTSANRSKGSVTPQEASLKLKRNIMTSFWPQNEFLGDFHTHPYGHYSEVTNSWCEFSDADIKDIQSKRRQGFWISNKYRVGLVLTIAKMDKKGSKKNDQVNDSCLEFTLGHFRLWLKAYVAYLNQAKRLILSKSPTDKVCLYCPAIVGLQGEYTEFEKMI